MIKKTEKRIELASTDASFMIVHTPIAAGKSTAIRLNKNIHYNVTWSNVDTLHLRYIHDYDYSPEYVTLTSRDQRIYSSILSLIIGLGQVLKRYIIENDRTGLCYFKRVELEIMTHLQDVHFQDFFDVFMPTFKDEHLTWLTHVLKSTPIIKVLIPRGYRYPSQFTEEDQRAVLSRGMSIDEVVTRLSIYSKFDKHELFERGTILDWLREDLLRTSEFTNKHIDR